MRDTAKRLGLLGQNFSKGGRERENGGGEGTRAFCTGVKRAKYFGEISKSSFVDLISLRHSFHFADFPFPGKSTITRAYIDNN